MTIKPLSPMQRRALQQIVRADDNQHGVTKANFYKLTVKALKTRGLIEFTNLAPYATCPGTLWYVKPTRAGREFLAQLAESEAADDVQ